MHERRGPCFTDGLSGGGQETVSEKADEQTNLETCTEMNLRLEPTRPIVRAGRPVEPQSI